MNERIRRILDQIDALENEIQSELIEQRSKFFYQIQGRRIEFERSIKETHRSIRVSVFRWFMTVRPQNYLTAPIIYGMVVPLVVCDVCIMLYQLTCFPIYGIPKVRRSDYISFDHRHLAYLNIIEKFNCVYCSYGNGIMGYASEVIARTEQYFCPIKHAQKILGKHARYQYFLDYGEAEDLHRKLEEIRTSLINENGNSANS
ncbi:MAG TPA: hypothetical protein VMV48_03080 [Gallionellaceae bacterium]|nr:hypothetical protein [Gallionellaceae bacterium]